MDAKDYRAVWGETVAAVLEENAFMFAEPCSTDELDLPYDACLRASMRFSGAEQAGFVWLLLPRSSCGELAANIRGVDMEECTAQDGADALKELLNVVCGRFLTSLYGREPIFQLSIPDIGEIAEEDWQIQVKLDGVFGFDLEGVPALAGIALEIAALEQV